ncbi:MAG: DUF4041 domain-containing protein [Chloroflexi bacterium]|nr:DUF4041 domain-containing protein [Chloroflexota bacterium]MBP8055298.1 DUF4041 domain-containing protein [Chloroflexota bacterium]
MSILDVFKLNEIKSELASTQRELQLLQKTMSETGHMDIVAIKKAIAQVEEQKNKANLDFQAVLDNITRTRRGLEQEVAELNQQVAAKKRDLIVLDDEILLQSFAIYTPKYDLENSEAYKKKLDQIRQQQAAMVKENKAAYATQNWTINNNAKEGERMVKDYIKLILRSFNNECDASIINVKFNNVDSIEKKIRKAFETLNKLGQRMTITIATGYLNLKLQELYLCHEYQVKKQQEKEEQKRLREQMREEAKLLREIEEQKLKLEKEEKHFNKAFKLVQVQLERAESDAEKDALQRELATIRQKLAELEKNKLTVQYREQNTRAGYVYVISNLGAFGENVYKIGVTRRLDPLERVDELGDASVPFDFDVHALIFSDDAPALENALHKAFESRRLNLINRRREFFHVSLNEIAQVVKNNFSKPVEFTLLADAAEYRQSLVLKGVSVPTI